MAKYELTLLLDNEDEVARIKKLIGSAEVKIVSEEKWGKKTLAYPVKKKDDAYFYYLVLDSSEKDVNQLKKKLGFDEKLLRYLLLKKE